jgi:penicillin amidase
MHVDSLSLRALHCVPALLKVLDASSEHALLAAARCLRAWDGRMEPDSIGAALFELFFMHWTRAVAAERFDTVTAPFIAGAVNGLAAALLTDDAAGWFAAGAREKSIRAAMSSALAWLTNRLGPDMAQWNWGALHTLTLRHILSGRGDLGTLLDHGGQPVPGNAHTVCNTGLGPSGDSKTGANYRLVADLSTAPPGLWSVDSQSQSGHPGSRHYSDQLQTWLNAHYYYVPLDRDEASKTTATRLVLEPK